MGIVKLERVSKSYGRNKVLENISLDIKKGEMVAIVGNSGKGKSTLLNIIGLIEDFDSGLLTIDSEVSIRINSLKATKLLREKISYLFQNFALIDNETVEDNLILALKYVKLSKGDKKDKIKEALKNVDLSGYEKRKIYELSGGEQQRVAIARIMLKPCEIILADEPTGSLDEENRNIIFKLLKKINDSGKTLIIVTHDKYIAKECDRIINL